MAVSKFIVFQLDPPTGERKPPSDRSAIPVAHVPADAWDAAAATRIDAQLDEGPAEFAALLNPDSRIRVRDLDDAVRVLESDPEAEAVLVTPRAGRLSRALERFPRRMALLMGGVADAALVIRRGSFRAGLGPGITGQPLWAWAVRTDPSALRIHAVDLEPMPVGTFTPNLLRALAPPAPGPEMSWLASALRSFDLTTCAPRATSPADSVAVHAGLWQLHDFLDQSHTLAQSIEGEGRHRSGDHWHAIMHRREPDESNSKYWYRRVGRSPLFLELAPLATDILAAAGDSTWTARLLAGGTWDPFAFVDCCAAARNSGDASLAAGAARLQQIEMDLLLEQSFADATS